MTFMMTRIRVDDFDSWKSIFDGDPPGARREAAGHRLYRSVEDPNQVFIAVEFSSPQEAKTARERLLASGVLDRVEVKTEPTIVEQVEAIAYAA
jgi:hypothetical protein